MNGIPHGKLLIDPDILQDPYPLYRQLHSHAPVWEVTPDEIYFISSYRLLAEATARTESFSSNMRYLLYRAEDGQVARMPFDTAGLQTLATSDPPVHTLHKATAFPNFALKRMALLEPQVVDIVRTYLEPAIEKGKVDFMAAVANRVPITVISWLIGFRDSNLDALLRAAFDSTDILAGAISIDELRAFIARTDTISAWVGEQMELTATDPDEDVLTAIGDGVRKGVIAAQEGVVMLHTFLAAGGESTTSLIGNCVRVLAERPNLQEHLRQHPDLVATFVEEILRFESPFRVHMRFAPNDATLGDINIPAGATVLMAWGAANRDASVFEKPDEIIFNRTSRHFGFGRGIHTCLGAPLARLEARVVLKMLLERTKSIELDPENTPRWVSSVQVRRYDKLGVHLTPKMGI
jgi:cytochrome P450 family 144